MEDTANVGKDAARDVGKVRRNTSVKTSVSKRVVGNVLERGDGTSGSADNAEVSSNAESVTFNADNHTYWRGSTRIPGVSEILKKVGLSKDYSGISPFYAERGKAVHLAIQYFLEKRLDINSLDEIIKPFFKAFLSYYYKDESRLGHILALEQPMASANYSFAGTPDLVTETIYDWKCSKEHDKVADLQGEFYKAIVFDRFGLMLPFIVVELHEDGTYAEFPYGSDVKHLGSVMDLYRWRLNRN